MAITPGLYRHYKGGLYRVLHLGLLEADETPMVIYQEQNETDRIWVRPVAEFEAPVEVDGQIIRRFERVDSE